MPSLRAHLPLLAAKPVPPLQRRHQGRERALDASARGPMRHDIMEVADAHEELQAGVRDHVSGASKHTALTEQTASTLADATSTRRMLVVSKSSLGGGGDGRSLGGGVGGFGGSGVCFDDFGGGVFKCRRSQLLPEAWGHGVVLRLRPDGRNLWRGGGVLHIGNEPILLFPSEHMLCCAVL